jgi:serine/threonine protein kinase
MKSARPTGVRFIATEYIKGETLRQRMRREPLSLRECFEVAVQVAAALSAAHEAKVVHPDIKPENIMLRLSVNHGRCLTTLPSGS